MLYSLSTDNILIMLVISACQVEVMNSVNVNILLT